MHEVAIIQSGLILGFGPTTITITAEVPERLDRIKKDGFVYLFYVHVNFGQD